ncbi:F0F1 ATP synthase subunit A [Sphingomonas sabuli]|uniref:ATP synthase subunit a n=1 Tax=Sphingomonas sabuli TaxID=2764186 RepID=A0A7G9L5T6_9SPHN|nr:F0F1 ATP synthase subunit A [Sphingomonas sabuli]QNM83985.1 F0F1 ATP synthase subunit A [Sphingomonas sabuli]
MAAEGKIDPMHQFTVQPLVPLHIGEYDVSFTNSAAWMLAALALIGLFMWGGMRRQVVPGRWQMAVEGLTGFIDDMLNVNIGPNGKKYVPYIFSLFTFILACNLLGLMPFGIIPGFHAFTPTSHFSITGVLAIISFSIVLLVGFAKHKLHFFSLFVPHGTPIVMVPLIFIIEFISFMVRPFSLGLRLFVAMIAGHILMEVFGSFIISAGNTFAAEPASGGGVMGLLVSAISFLFIIGVSALELLVAAIQAYVFALLTTLYLNDAENLH